MQSPLKPLLAIAAMLCGMTIPVSSQAVQKQVGFPARPLTIIVPYGPGGGSDQLSRAMARSLQEVTGVLMEVINQPGAGGMVAVPGFMRAPKDGHTIMEAIDDAVTNHVSGRMVENPSVDWVPICMAQITFSQIYIRPGDPRFSDWPSFVAYARANPGKLKVANVGNIGSMERINMLKLEKALGIQTKQIPYNFPTDRYSALVGQRVDALFEQPGDVRKFLDTGLMKPILTLYNERPAAFPNVPTSKEAGALFEPLLRFRGFFVHQGVPKKRRAYLETACKEAFGTPSFQEFNKSKYMHLIDSYRDTAGSLELIKGALETYRAAYGNSGLLQ